MFRTNTYICIVDFLSEKVIYELKDEEFGLQALKVTEKEIKYLRINKKQGYAYTPI